MFRSGRMSFRVCIVCFRVLTNVYFLLPFPAPPCAVVPGVRALDNVTHPTRSPHHEVAEEVCAAVSDFVQSVAEDRPALAQQPA